MYGPIGSVQALALTRHLTACEDPAQADPLLPWAAAVDRGDSIAITASTMLSSSIFWAVDDGPDGPVLTAGTDPGGVLRHRRAATHLDIDWLQAFVGGSAPPDHTAYVDVHRLLPGHTMVWKPGQSPQLTQWCGPRVWAQSAGRKVTVAQYRAQFDEVIDAIAAASPSLVGQLSGGLDSTFALASAASSSRLNEPIHAYLSVPVPEAQLTPGGRINDETRYVNDLARRYPGRIHVTAVANTAGVQPLDVAAVWSRAAWLPSPAASNQVWISMIQHAAAHHGARLILTGQAGNFSFSPYYPPSSVRRRLARTLRRTGPLMDPPARDGFLAHLAGHVRPNMGVLNPAALGGLLHADPYRARPLLDLAAAVSPKQWGCEPWPRGFARRVAEGRVPDSIRLRVARGAQSPDVWWWIKSQRERYLDEATMLHDSDIAAHLDIPALRTELHTWPWGQTHGPTPRDITRVHRILTTADFARDMSIRLRRISTCTPDCPHDS